MQILGFPLNFGAISKSLLGQEGSEAAAAEPSPRKETQATPAPIQASSALRQLLAQHDVRSITPREFANLVPLAKSTGDLNPQEIETLTALSRELMGAGLDPDHPVDLLEFAADKLQDQFTSPTSPLDDVAEQSESQAQVALRSGQIEVLRKFSLLHQGAGTTLDLVA